MTPNQFWRAAAAQTRLNLAVAETMWRAAFVIPTRLWSVGSAAAVATTPAAAAKVARESVQMVTEKIEEAVAATAAASVQAMTSKDANVVALAAANPIKRRVRANHRKLAKPAD